MHDAKSRRLWRFMLLGLVFVLLMASACTQNDTGPKPKAYISKDAMKYGTMAMDAVQDYLDGKAGFDETDAILKECSGALADHTDSFDWILSSYIQGAEGALFNAEYEIGTKSDLRAAKKAIYDAMYETEEN